MEGRRRIGRWCRSSKLRENRPHATQISEDPDIDALFFYKNVVVISEDTCGKNLKDHINKTGIFYQKLKSHSEELFSYLRNEYPEFEEGVAKHFDHFHEVEFRFIYCSLEAAQLKHFSPHPVLNYLSMTSIRYFLALSRTIHFSLKFELLKFLKVELGDLGSQTGKRADEYEAFILPESPSGFPPGHRVITFYIDPETLIERAYVLRKDSWLDGESLYQRMMIKAKIKSMREFLATDNRVFINNIIVSLPHTITFKSMDDEEIKAKDIRKTQSLKIVLPTEFNSIGIIDGQHRLYCYHEGQDKFEEQIKGRRSKQQLLVTGVIFPKQLSDLEKSKFQARMFLEINDKQSRARGDLKQSIETIVNPFSAIALAKSVISSMAKDGPLTGLLEDHMFGSGTIKTSSIVSYGLRHIVDVGEDPNSSSFFGRWKGKGKRAMVEAEDPVTRSAYVKFCASNLNMFLSGFKSALDAKFWTTKRTESRALSTTTLNGLIFCMRTIIEKDKLGDFNSYSKSFGKLDINFTPGVFEYKSSHWRDLGSHIYTTCFEDT